MNALPDFADPLWLLALAALPFFVWRHHARSRHGALLVSRLPQKTGGAWRLHLPFYLAILAFAALTVALARPRLGYTWEEATTEGIDIQIVVDVSHFKQRSGQAFRPPPNWRSRCAIRRVGATC